MSFKIRRFTSGTVLATKATREEAESFADDYVTEYGGVVMIEEETMSDFTSEMLKEGFELVLLVGQCIRESPNGEIPSGHLYARLMGSLNLQAYESIIRILKKSNLITESNHLLKWIGPAKGV